MPEETEPPQVLIPIEAAVKKIKANTPDIPKYFLTEDEGLTVKADLDGYEVVYDLANARAPEEPDGRGAGKDPGDGKTGLQVVFSVKDQESGELRTGSFLWTIEGDDSGILLAFDDDYGDIWVRYLDLLDRYGVGATFFVQGELTPFCTEAVSRGHEIGYHTKNHLNLLKVSRQVFLEETLGDVSAFRRRGLPLRAFAYPYGLSEPWMHQTLAETYAILRGFGSTCRIYSADTIRMGYVSSKSIDNIMYKSDAFFKADIIAMLRIVKFIGGVLPLTTHTIDGTAAWGISPERLEYLLKNAVELRLKFYHYGDFF
jgi:hypothetical protein